jgi:hypothetical protein
MTKDSIMCPEERKKEFLWELTQLSHKYGIGIDDEDGCLYILNTEDPLVDGFKGYKTDENGKLLFLDNVYS